MIFGILDGTDYLNENHTMSLLSLIFSNAGLVASLAVSAGGIYALTREPPVSKPGRYDHITDPEERYVLTKMETVRDDPELVRHYQIIKAEQELGLR